MLTNADITLYNKYMDPIEKLDKYKRTYIKNVVWNASKGVNVLRSGLSTADSAAVLIFENASDTQEKPYKEPKAWLKTPNVDMDKYFTIATGDIIVLGIIDYDINVGGLSGLEKTHDNVLKIKSVDYTNQCSHMLHNWRVGAG